MSDAYKLVYRGEVLDGQHPAVVRRRLAEGAGFADDALDKLFSGNPVVLKREADTATAARLQAVFKKAGARLRVLPVETGSDSAEPVAQAQAHAQAAAADGSDADRRGAASASQAGADFELFPPGSPLLRDSERRSVEAREVDTSGLHLEEARFDGPEPRPEVAGPDVSHLSVADVGADLGPAREVPPAPVVAPDLGVATVGARLGPDRSPVTPAIDLAGVTFEVAPPGSELGPGKSAAAPPAPDVSHLSLEERSDRGH